MKPFNFNLSREEARLALELVAYVVYNAKKDEHDNQEGIFINVSEFLKFIRYEDLPNLVSLVDKYSIYEDLDLKIKGWQTEGED